MTDILITAYQVNGTFETESLHYTTGALVGNAVPEPPSLLLFAGAALVLVGGLRRTPTGVAASACHDA